MTRMMTATMAAALALSSTWSVAQVPAGPDFVTLGPSGQGGRPAGAAQPNGGYVVIWHHRDQGGQINDVHGRRLSRHGTLLGDEFLVNTYTTGLQMERTARPAVDARGNFVVAWSDYEGYSDVKAQRFYADGTRRDLEFQPNTLVANTAAPRVAGGSDGRFVVVWWVGVDYGQVAARRYDAAGSPIGSEFLASTYPDGAVAQVDVAMSPDGAFVVAWTSEAEGGPGSSNLGIRVQLFDANGTRLGTEFAANTFTSSLQRHPSLAMAADGRFVVAWTSRGQDGEGDGVFARRFDASGAPLGAEFQVNTYTPVDEVYPSVASDERGNFVVTWNEQVTGPFSRTRGRRFFADGTPRGAEFPIADGLPAFSEPAVTSDPVGNFLVAFSSPWDGNGVSPLARRYQGLVPDALTLNDSPGDGNGVLDPGEWAHVGSTWRNLNGSNQTIAGTAPAFTGPAGATYTLLSASATYGTLADGDVAACNPCYAVEVSNPGARPAAHWDTVLEEHLLPDVQGQVKLWKLHVGRSFSDVSAASPFYRYVETLLHQGVTAGCGPGRFCPQASTTREQMATFVLVSKEGTGYVPPACTTGLFGDVPPTSPFCPWVEELARRGVVQGCGGGLYCPTDPVNREQMAVFVLRTLDPALTPPACVPPNLFADVPESSPFCSWIEELARRGIATGCGGGSYCPAQPVTREQMGPFLGVTFGLTLYGV